MPKRSSKSLALVLLPVFIPIVAVVVFGRSGQLPDLVPSWIGPLTYVLLGASCLLGWRFNRSRVTFGALCTAVWVAVFTLDLSYRSPLLIGLVGLVLPLNLVWISLWRERGIITVAGFLRASVFAAQGCGVAWLLQPAQLGTAEMLTQGWLKLPASMLANLGLTEPSTIAMGLAVIFLAVRVFRHRDAVDAGFIGVLILVGLTHASGGTGISVIYAAATGLMLLISIVEASHALAFRDELTGLPGRRSLDECLSKLSGRYAVAMVDVDHFKKFNDRFGHDVGDQALRLVASRLASVKGGGRAYRYGGEEFAVVFPGKTAGEAEPHLNKLRKTIGDNGFTLRGSTRPTRKPKTTKKSRQRRRSQERRIKLTVSIGAAHRHARGMTPGQVLKAADQRLYKSKRTGRNRVTV